MKILVKILRYLLFCFLLCFAILKVSENIELIKDTKLDLIYFGLLFVPVAFSYICQAWMTVQITNFCRKKIKLNLALGVNLMAGLWGIIFPMGSVGYKALYFKKVLNIEIFQYSKFYGLSFLSSVMVSFFVMSIAFVFQRDTFLFMLFISCFALLMLLFIYRETFFAKYIHGRYPYLEVLFENEVWNRLFGLSIIHFFGIMIYILIYKCSFLAFESEISFLSLAVFVAMQNLMFLLPIVPGNFVLLEAVASMYLSQSQGSTWDPIFAVILMRIVSLIFLIVFGFLSFIFLRKKAQ